MKTPNYRLGLHARLGRKFNDEDYTTHSEDKIDGLHFIIHENNELPMKLSNRFYIAINETSSFTIAPQLKTMDTYLYSTSLQE